MRTGWFRQVHVKSRQCRLWRSLLVARRTVLNHMRSPDRHGENVIRAITREAGIKLGTPSRKDFAPRVREMAGSEPELMAHPVRRGLEPLLAVLASMIEELARLTKRVLDIVKNEASCKKLMTAPLRGLLAAEGRYQSGETDLVGKFSRCGDELARTGLVEAAHTLLARGSKWSALRVWGLAVAKRRGMAKAKIAVARKLAVILHRMWIDDADFSFAKEA